jgi:hypothetical protein
MTNTALGVLFILTCTLLGALGGARMARARVAVVLAVLMVAAELVLLTR